MSDENYFVNSYKLTTASSDERRLYNAKHKYYTGEPTYKDYSDTYELLRDFGIKNPRDIVPDFKTRNQLIAWRTKYIKDSLS